MNRFVRPPRGLLGPFSIVLGLTLLGGCDRPGTPRPEEGKLMPEGKLLKNGLPLKPQGGGDLPPGDAGYQVLFLKLDGNDAGTEMQASIIDEELGTFELVGPEGKGIPPGKYRVAVIMAPEGGEDAFKGKYNLENSKIEVEVKEGEDLVIDLDNYK